MSGREAVLPDSFSPDGGSTPGPGVLEEFAQACRGDLTRVRISGGVREFDCTAELIVTHSHLSQRGRSAARGDEVENAGGGVGYTQGSRYSRHDFRDARRVERHCLGKDNGVVEHAANRSCHRGCGTTCDEAPYRPCPSRFRPTRLLAVVRPYLPDFSDHRQCSAAHGRSRRSPRSPSSP